MSDKKPQEDMLDYAIKCIPASTSRGMFLKDKALVELAILREDANRWRRLRKRFFDDFGTPEEEQEITPIDDTVIHNIYRDHRDALRWRAMDPAYYKRHMSHEWMPESTQESEDD